MIVIFKYNLIQLFFGGFIYSVVDIIFVCGLMNAVMPYFNMVFNNA
ncbi:hypothetical protein XIS1_60003 [Xenorhabdus innexi]|uniref:Uncharacterized protein n=1 Tax=Xenorhabdus innexi TaxID=290109 RepID=A0A1N6MZB5_9GAMM|nr:hypothetical protein XIS1_60003 [Xenorhabdus innexi]